jgi:hypothetical protein
MFGPDILARFLQSPSDTPDKYGNHWQYHPRSDRHSKVGCWGVAFDLLVTSSLLRAHAAAGKIVIGVNHKMTEFSTRREKALDLVIARPGQPGKSKNKTFASLADDFKIPLTEVERSALQALPSLKVAPVGSVLIALEAKAAMTEHVKALPRLYDELNSAHLCVHGASRQALAIAYVQVNLSDQFISPLRNKHVLNGGNVDVTDHSQPRVTERVLEKVSEIPRRSNSSDTGYDGIGVTVLKVRNDLGPVEIVNDPPAPSAGDAFNYGNMIMRMATEYDTVFANI